MKKIFLTIFVGIFCTTLSAQGLDLGVKAGVNFATLLDVSGFSNKTGFVVGGFAGVKFGEKIGIQADLLYSQQGAKFEGKDIDLNYVNIPVVLKYYVTKYFNLQAGPQFGFVVDDNFKKAFEDVKNAESFDLAGVVGVGFELPFGIRASGRYHFGLTEVSKSENGKNAVFTLAVGYSFL